MFTTNAMTNNQNSHAKIQYADQSYPKPILNDTHFNFNNNVNPNPNINTNKNNKINQKYEQ